MNHKEPVPMVYMEGATPFHACPRYMLKDDQHPDGHGPLEKACANRLSFGLSTKIVERLMEMVEDDVENGRYCDYTNLTFNCAGIRVRVLKYNPHEIRLGILNSRMDLSITHN